MVGTRKYWKKSGSYRVIDDDGREHVVEIHVEMVEATFNEGNTVTKPGQQQHRMTNGNHVNVNDDGTVEEVATGRVMRRV